MTDLASAFRFRASTTFFGFHGWVEMNRERKRASNLEAPNLRLIKYLHWAVTVLLFAGFWFWFRYPDNAFRINRAFRYNIYVIAFYGVMLAWFGKTFNAYTLGYFRVRHIAFSQFLADFFSIGMLYFAVSIGWMKFRNPACFLLMLLIQAVWNAGWSNYANSYYYRIVQKYRTAVIYRNETDLKRLRDITGKPLDRLFHVERYLQYDGTDFFALRDEIRDYDAIFAAGVNPTLMNALCKYCAESGVRGFFLPHIGDIIMSGAEHIKSFTTPVLSVRRATKSLEYLVIKRGFDIVASLCFLVILSPILLLVAAAIKLQDGGPVFYRQVRLTKDAKEFEIIKFRSMRVDAEKDGVARLSTGSKDDRITAVGRFIRACRMDELPQLINILKGDMSFVGPRPERPEIAHVYEKTLPEFALRLQVRAGLTGYAQVYGRYNSSPYEKLEFDLLYINDMSIITDIELMFNTFRILFKKESTEGVKEGLVTAMDYERETGSNTDRAETADCQNK